MTPITIRQIQEFVERNNLAETTFCKLVGLSPAWLSKVRMRAASEDTPITGHEGCLKKLRVYLDGTQQIPDSIRRRAKTPKTAAKLPSDDYDVTHLIQQLHETKKKFTFKDFKELCAADYLLRQIRAKHGL